MPSEDERSISQSTISDSTIKSQKPGTATDHEEETAESNYEYVVEEIDNNLSDAEMAEDVAPKISDLDPLNVKELSLNFDYLVYKINDKYKTLSEMAMSSTTRFKENTEITIMEVDKVIQYYYEMVKKLNEINNDLSKLRQLKMIVDDFVPRIKELERYFAAV